MFVIPCGVDCGLANLLKKYNLRFFHYHLTGVYHMEVFLKL